MPSGLNRPATGKRGKIKAPAVQPWRVKEVLDRVSWKGSTAKSKVYRDLVPGEA